MAIFAVNILLLKFLGLVRLEKRGALRTWHLIYFSILYTFLLICLVDSLNLWCQSKSMTDIVGIFPVTYMVLISWIKTTLFVSANDKICKDIEFARNTFKNDKKIVDFFKNFATVCSIVYVIPAIWSLCNPKLNEHGRVLPYHTTMPANYSDDRQYYLVYGYLICGAFCVVYTDLEIDILIISFGIYCCYQFRVVQQDLTYILNDYRCQNRWDDRKNTYDLKSFKIKFYESIRFHQELLRFVTRIDEYFRMIMLTEVVCCLLLCAATVFHAQKFSNNAYLTHAIAVMAKLFVATLVCEMLSHESEQVGNSIYLANWVEYNSEIRKDVAIIISRGQKPVTFTYQFGQMGLKIFLLILKASTSYYMLMRQTLGEEVVSVS